MEDRSARFRIGQLSTRTGVAPELLRKWESRYELLEPERSGGGFRIYSLDDERRVRLMQRHLSRGYAAAEAAVLARQGIVAPAPARLGARIADGVVKRSHGLLRRAIIDFDEGAAQRTLDDLFAAFSVEAVLRDAVLPFMRAVGEEWAAGRVSPGQEHFASALIEGRLLGLARGWGSGSGRCAVLACPSGERHTIGLVAFGIALSRRGWRITYLGADTPADSIAAAAARTEPAVVVLASVKSRCFTAKADELEPICSEWPTVIAGAGATRTVAARLGVQRSGADPVTSAARLASRQPAAARS